MKNFNFISKRKQTKNKAVQIALKVAMADHASSFEDVIGFILFAKNMDKLGVPIKTVKLKRLI